MGRKCKFEEAAHNYFKASQDLRMECIKYIKSVIKKYKVLDFSDFYSSVCVPYNGGNHPEYASNCFSNVYKVSLDERGDIILCIEDCEEYDLVEVPTENVFDIANFIKLVYIPTYNEK